MRKVMVWGFVLVAVALLFTGVQAQRIAPIQDAPNKTAGQVEVVNFPAVQTVGGTVNVGNLPLDGDGNLEIGRPVTLAVLAPLASCVVLNTDPNVRSTLNLQINFVGAGAEGALGNFSFAMRDDPAVTGTISDCLRLMGELGAFATTLGCTTAPLTEPIPTNVQLTMLCDGEANEIVRTMTALSREVLQLHLSMRP